VEEKQIIEKREKIENSRGRVKTVRGRGRNKERWRKK
jgi:hypothetical protein